MSYQEIKTSNIDLTTINRVSYPPFSAGVTLANTTLNARDLMLFTNQSPTTQITQVLSNAAIYVNPANSAMYATSFRPTSTATSYSTTPATITASSLAGGIVVNTHAGATTWNLDTTANLLSAFNFGAGTGQTVIVKVTEAGSSGVVTVVAGDGSTTVVGNAQSGSFQMYFVNMGSGLISVYV
jgi:hypothetical protein